MFGKILGGFFGYWVGGLFGALIGIWVGNSFDKGVSGVRVHRVGGADRQRIQRHFFTSLFSVMGALAKADGQVTDTEIRFARDVMTQMQLDESSRQEAIELFSKGKQPDFPLEQTLEQFRQDCGQYRDLIRMFIEILMHVGYADGELHSGERRLLNHIRIRLEFSELEFQQIEALVKNARHFGSGGQQGRHGAQVSPGQMLNEAYEIIGVTRESTDAQIKKAYRRLMSQHHPDKLVSKGLPEEMLKLATAKTQEIQKAYELIKDSRG